MTEWYVLWPLCFALCVPEAPARRWCVLISVLYMPLVIWHIVGPPQVVVLAQLTIFGLITVIDGGYFMWKIRSQVLA